MCCCAMIASAARFFFFCLILEAIRRFSSPNFRSCYGDGLVVEDLAAGMEHDSWRTTSWT